MKIEIELEAVESIRKELQKARQEIERLNKEIESLGEKELKQDAADLGLRIFKDYMTATFEKLGFGPYEPFDHAVTIEENLVHWLGKEWWGSERLRVNLSVHITQKWKKAFVRMGVRRETLGEAKGRKGELVDVKESDS